MNGRGNLYLAVGILLVTLAYGLFQARVLIHGPSLVVDSPQPGETVMEVMMYVQGSTENVTHLSINGRPVTMGLDGSFNEPLVTPGGYGVVLVEAEDRFGRTTKQTIEFVGKPETTNEQ